MTQVLDRPKTEVDVRTQTEVRPRPIELDREVRQLPPVGEPPGRFRWLGWLLGIAAVAAAAWFVIGEITADDTPVASPSYVVPDGGITADPKARTPVAMTESEIASIQTGIPGSATLTDVVTLGHTPAESLEDATVNPGIFWAVQPTYATNMEEATVNPSIYHTTRGWSLDTYDLISTYPQVTTSALPGVYWRHDAVIDEQTFGIVPPLASPVATPTVVLDGAFWRHDVVIDEQTYGIWPQVAAAPRVPVVDYGWADWPPYVPVQVEPTPSYGGHANIMR